MSNKAPVDLYMFQPLNVRLWVAEHFTLKVHITADHNRAIGWQASLQDWPVGRALCNTTKRHRNVSFDVSLPVRHKQDIKEK